jgi:DNA-directed RNA polymerase specialized sigma24 family protein
MVTMSRRPLTGQEEQDLNTQLAFFWNGRTPGERNAYANVLVFLILTGGDPLASAAFEVIVHEIIKNSSTLLPFSIDNDEEFRATVAVAVMEKLRGSKEPGKQPLEPWQRLVAYHRDHDIANGNFRAWLKIIAYRTAVDLLRRHPMSAMQSGDRRWVRNVPVEDWDDGSQSMEQWYAETPLPVRLDVLRALVATGKWLQGQPQADLDVLCLHIDHGLRYSAIAREVGSTSEAVRKRITRMRRRLKEHLDSIFSPETAAPEGAGDGASGDSVSGDSVSGDVASRSAAS